MHYTIVERKDGALLPLAMLIERLSLVGVAFWSLRQMTFTAPSAFFGISISDVEKLTCSLSRGLVLADEDFQALIRTDMQVIDGIIEAYSDSGRPLLQIECFDSSQWDIHTVDENLDRQLQREGFKPMT